MNEQIRQLLATATYDQLERLEELALHEHNLRLANLIDQELRSRQEAVADAIRNIYETLEDLSEE